MSRLIFSQRPKKKVVRCVTSCFWQFRSPRGSGTDFVSLAGQSKLIRTAVPRPPVVWIQPDFGVGVNQLPKPVALCTSFLHDAKLHIVHAKLHRSAFKGTIMFNYVCLLCGLKECLNYAGPFWIMWHILKKQTNWMPPRCLWPVNEQELSRGFNFFDRFWFAWHFVCVKSNRTWEKCAESANATTDSDKLQVWKCPYPSITIAVGYLYATFGDCSLMAKTPSSNRKLFSVGLSET